MAQESGSWSSPVGIVLKTPSSGVTCEWSMSDGRDLGRVFGNIFGNHGKNGGLTYVHDEFLGFCFFSQKTVNLVKIQLELRYQILRKKKS